MLRITKISKNSQAVQLRVEGRIAPPDLAQLQATAEATLGAHVSLLVDLAGVQYVDPTGVELLRTLRRRGTMLIGCSGFLNEMMREQPLANLPSVTDVAVDEPGSEAQLLRQLRCGDAAAFERVVRQHGGRMLAAARRVLGNDDDAQDAVQEAFFSAFKAIDQFAGTAKLSTWLHRIVLNTALMKLRSRRRRPEESIEDRLPRFDDQGSWLDEPQSWGTASDVLLERRETRATVRRCIERLPETHRTVLLLRDIEELDTDEAARMLDISPNAVKIRLHRARQALRALLEEGIGSAEARPVHVREAQAG